ncbi:MAG: hypothetical protein K2Q26_01225 [Bdellovibrionales bacterium]|nr:hypothetical protein [Bdellovibrionales bacterium]
MAELFFVLKCFVMSVFLVFCMQFKIKNQTVETRLTSSLRETRAHHWLADMGLGGVNLVRAMVAQATGQPAPVPWRLESNYIPESRATASDFNGPEHFENLRKNLMEVQQQRLEKANAVTNEKQSETTEPDSVPK